MKLDDQALLAAADTVFHAVPDSGLLAGRLDVGSYLVRLRRPSEPRRLVARCFLVAGGAQVEVWRDVDGWQAWVAASVEDGDGRMNLVSHAVLDEADEGLRGAAKALVVLAAAVAAGSPDAALHPLLDSLEDAISAVGRADRAAMPKIA